MVRQRIGIILLWVVGMCTALPDAGAGSAWAQTAPLVEVGVARIDITPEEPVRLSGYGGRRTPPEGVAQRLWAKAVAFGSERDGPALLIAVDLIGVPGSLTEYLAARLAQRVGLPRTQLAVLATHTHAGPAVLGVLPNIFGETIPPEHLAAIGRYTERLAERLEQVALAALAARRPAQLAWGQGEVTFAVNRRVIEDGTWTGFGVNPAGPVDHALPVLRVTDPDGTLRAVLLSYACHCTTLGGDFNQIHGDWAGAAQEFIEARHPGAVALVTIGCGADANPYPRGGLEQVAQHGRAIAEEVDRLLQTPLRPLSAPPDGRLRRIDLPFEQVPTLDEWVQRAAAEGRDGYHARLVLDRLVRGETVPSTLSYPIQTWTFGDDLAMVFLAGEVVVDYALRLKRELDADRLWVNAYANDLVCYIASRRMLPEGGYEVDASMHSYDRPSRFAPMVEDRIIETVRALLPPAYAQRPGPAPR